MDLLDTFKRLNFMVFIFTDFLVVLLSSWSY